MGHNPVKEAKISPSSTPVIELHHRTGASQEMSRCQAVVYKGLQFNSQSFAALLTQGPLRKGPRSELFLRLQCQDVQAPILNDYTLLKYFKQKTTLRNEMLEACT